MNLRSNFCVKFLISLLLLGWTPFTWATSVEQCDSFILEAGETLDDEHWIRASSIQLMGSVKDDCFLFGSNILLQATFEDDVWALGGTVEFNGTAEDRLRIGASHLLKTTGEFRDGLSAYAKTIHLQKDTVVHEAAQLAGEHVLIEGIISNSTFIAASKVTLMGTIYGDLRVIADDVVILPGSKIYGDVLYTLAKELVPGKEVEITGELKQVSFEDYLTQAPGWLSERWSWLHIVFFFNALLIGFLYILTAPRQIGHAVHCCRTLPLRCLLLGLLVFFVLPGLIQLLLYTRYGIPAAAVLLTTYLLVMYFGKLIVALGLGGIILRLQGRQPLPKVFLSLALGAAILYFVMSLPFFGFVIWLSVGSYGLGGILHAQLESQLVMTRTSSEKENPAPTPEE